MIVPAMSDPEPEPDQNEGPHTEPAPDPAALSPEDFYLEGPYMVFTAAYHLKRGYCCNSDCRHCPYR